MHLLIEFLPTIFLIGGGGLFLYGIKIRFRERQELARQFIDNGRRPDGTFDLNHPLITFDRNAQRLMAWQFLMLVVVWAVASVFAHGKSPWTLVLILIGTIVLSVSDRLLRVITRGFKRSIRPNV